MLVSLFSWLRKIAFDLGFVLEKKPRRQGKRRTDVSLGGVRNYEDRRLLTAFSITTGLTGTEGNTGSTVAVLTISVDAAPTASMAMVSWATADGSAKVSDTDYTANNGTLSFGMMDTVTFKTITVSV